MENNKKPSNPTIQQGWTLRDEFANSAMQGILSNSAQIETFMGNTLLPLPTLISHFSYELSDAMLKQREL